jgi:hypothetical protein
LSGDVEIGSSNAGAGASGRGRGNLGRVSDTSCFYPGTRIATPDGQLTVEALRTGDLVLDSDANVIPIRWMGRKTASTRFEHHLHVLPVCVAAGALGDNLPTRDLLVSQDHALLVDGLLIHAGALLNGTTIRRHSAVPETFTYFHIELAEQALVMAEGVPAETVLDNVDRLDFDNWAEYVELYGDALPVIELPLPRAKSRRQVPMQTRWRLAARAEQLLRQARYVVLESAQSI